MESFEFSILTTIQQKCKPSLQWNSKQCSLVINYFKFHISWPFPFNKEYNKFFTALVPYTVSWLGFYLKTTSRFVGRCGSDNTILFRVSIQLDVEHPPRPRELYRYIITPSQYPPKLPDLTINRTEEKLPTARQWWKNKLYSVLWDLFLLHRVTPRIG
jgi:hypothetical protein